jgi:hypothetical protein
MWDMKPDAGGVSGIQQHPQRHSGYRVSELMPKLSQMCSKLAILRSVHHTMNEHSQATHTVLWIRSHQGDPLTKLSVGSIVAKAGLAGDCRVHRRPGAITHGRSGYLGVAATLRDFGYPTAQLSVRNLQSGGRHQRRAGGTRKKMLENDTVRRDADASGAIGAMDEFRRQAFELATSPQIRRRLTSTRKATRPATDTTRNGRQGALLAGSSSEGPVRYRQYDLRQAVDSHVDNFTPTGKTPGHDFWLRPC